LQQGTDLTVFCQRNSSHIAVIVSGIDYGIVRQGKNLRINVAEELACITAAANGSARAADEKGIPGKEDILHKVADTVGIVPRRVDDADGQSRCLYLTAVRQRPLIGPSAGSAEETDSHIREGVLIIGKVGCMVAVGVGYQQVGWGETVFFDDRHEIFCGNGGIYDGGMGGSAVREDVGEILIKTAFECPDFHGFIQRCLNNEMYNDLKSKYIIFLAGSISRFYTLSDMTSQKEFLAKILAPLTKEGIDVSSIDLGKVELSRDAALALQREVRMIVMRGQHTTVDFDGESVPVSPEEISDMLKEIIIPYQKTGGKS